MPISKIERPISKTPLADSLESSDQSALQKYREFFVGSTGFKELITFELCEMLLAPLPGALGIWLRKLVFPHLFKRVGSNALFGRDIALRHPRKIVLGDGVAIDDHCILDARGAGDEGIRIGDHVIIARDTLIQGKTGPVTIGSRCVIGSQCQLSSAGGIHLGSRVMLAGQCYIGGGRYHYEKRDVPMMDQGLYSQGPVVIGDDVWLGAGVTVLDGVRIGKGSFVGAGSIVTEDIGEYQIVAPYQKQVILPRGVAEPAPPPPGKNSLATADGSPAGAGGGLLFQRALEVVHRAIDEINRQLPRENRLEKGAGYILYQDAANRNLDSLGLVNLVVTLEEEIKTEFGLEINLAEVRITGDSNPLRTVGTLAEYTAARIMEQQAAAGGGKRQWQN